VNPLVLHTTALTCILWYQNNHSNPNFLSFQKENFDLQSSRLKWSHYSRWRRQFDGTQYRSAKGNRIWLEAFNFEAKNKLQEWKTWNRQFQWFATLFGSNKQPAEVQVSTFLNWLRRGVVPLFKSFNLSKEKINKIQKSRDKKEKIWLDRTHSTEKSKQNLLQRIRMEPTRKKKTWMPKSHLEAHCLERMWKEVFRWIES
jgi:hypothetical protein